MATTPDFQTTLGFTADDLAANRRGQLTEPQIQVRKQTARSSALGCLGGLGFLMIFAVTFLIVLGSAGFSTSKAPGMNILGLIGVIVPGFFCLVLGFFMLIAIKTALFPQTPSLNRLTGTIVRGNPTRRKGMYEIELNGRPFEVSKAAYDLIDNTKIYTIYTADIVFTRLSVYSTNDNNKIIALEEADAEAVTTDKSPLEFQNEQLGRLFNFTSADLAANRAGKVSPEQSERLSKAIGSGILGGTTNGLFVGVILLAAVGGVSQNLALAVVISGAAFVVAYLLSLRGTRRQQADLAKALHSKLAVAQGTAEVKITKREHRSSRRSYTETVYHVQVGDKAFEVREDVYYAFKAGNTYAIYYVKALHSKIMSAEQIG
jgi:hypothetical protein